MVSLTIFGGSEIEMRTESQVVLTLFGSTHVYCPTATQELLRLTEENPRTSPWHKKEHPDQRRNLYVTIFGSISIHRPLLGREYVDLKNLLRSGAIDLGDFQVLWMRHTSTPTRKSYRAITLFGSCEQELASRREEEKELDRLLERRAIDRDEHEELARLLSEDRAAALSGLPRIAARFATA